MKIMELPGFKTIFHKKARNKYLNPEACRHIKLNGEIKLKKAVKELMSNSIDYETRKIINHEIAMNSKVPEKKETLNTNEEFLKLKKKITIRLKSQGVTEELID
jgi:hypothetical protein